MSLSQIAREEQVSMTTIKRWMESCGLRRRPFSTKGMQTRLGAILSDETKKKISEKHMGKKLSPEHREKVIQTLQNGECLKGANNHRWKGGRIITGERYIFVRKLGHPRSRTNGYVGQHVLNLEEKLGRYLTDDEVCHHINEIRWDNRPENLQVMTFREHSRYHRNLEAQAEWAAQRFLKEVV